LRQIVRQIGRDIQFFPLSMRAFAGFHCPDALETLSLCCDTKIHA
jgi:hypothetical protein